MGPHWRPAELLFLLAMPCLAAGPPPVILVDGYHVLCGWSVASPRTFGELEERLRQAGHDVWFFSHCQFHGRPRIETMAADLGRLIEKTGAPQVDLVAYSMGGLIARAYLAGMQPEPGVFRPPARHRVRKLVMIATPNFGALFRSRHAGRFLDPQARDMVPGSRFLFDLATWTAAGDPLRGVDAIAIAGDGGNVLLRTGASDGLIPVISASLAFARSPDRTRIVPYCHGDVQAALVLDGGCHGPPIAKARQEGHLTPAIVLSFLSGSDEWRNLGVAAAADAYLLTHAGVLMDARDAQDRGESGRVRFESGSLAKGPYAHYGANLAPGTYLFQTRSASLECALWPGVYRALVAKPGPWIEQVELASGWIVIHGDELEDAAFEFGGAPLRISDRGDRWVRARLPPASGLVTLTATAGRGRHTVRVMVEPAPDTLVLRRLPPGSP